MDLRARITGLMAGVRDELAEIVAIPSVADARQYPPAECARAAERVRGRFAGVGFADARLTATADGSSAVVGSRPCADPRAPTVLVHLTALRALPGDVPVHLTVVVEGSEEQGTGGPEAYVAEHADLLPADAVPVCDTGNAAALFLHRYPSAVPR